MVHAQLLNSPAERLLDAAALLFVREGIRAVGIDRLIAQAEVARGSLYQAFGSKDQLIAAFLRRQHERDQARWEEAVAPINDPTLQALTFFDLASATAAQREYRGCLYLNAATEFPEREHPANAVIADHRQWMRNVLHELVDAAGLPRPKKTAETVQLLYDGALAGSKFAKSIEPILHARQLASYLLSLAEHETSRKHVGQ